MRAAAVWGQEMSTGTAISSSRLHQRLESRSRWRGDIASVRLSGGIVLLSCFVAGLSALLFIWKHDRVEVMSLKPGVISLIIIGSAHRIDNHALGRLHWPMAPSGKPKAASLSLEIILIFDLRRMVQAKK